MNLPRVVPPRAIEVDGRFIREEVCCLPRCPCCSIFGRIEHTIGAKYPGWSSGLLRYSVTMLMLSTEPWLEKAMETRVCSAPNPIGGLSFKLMSEQEEFFLPFWFECCVCLDKS